MSHCHTTADITADTEPGDCSEASAAVLQYICQVSPFMIRDSGCCQLSVLSPGNTHHLLHTFGEDGGPQLAGGGAVQQVVLPGQTRLLPAPGRSQGGGGGGLLVIGAHGGVSCTMAGSHYKATPWLGHITRLQHGWVTLQSQCWTLHNWWPVISPCCRLQTVLTIKLRSAVLLLSSRHTSLTHLTPLASRSRGRW